MNTVVLRRRLIYISAIVLLLVPLYFLGNPSVRNNDGSVKKAGGTLAQIRSAHNLGQGDLGEIDPASESVRLATLGLRGVAATILWQKAEYYKKEQYWDRLSATLNQISVLQPHFLKVWDFQSHNLAYNVSSEFDNYRHRYQWVKKGVDYLVKGAKYNKAKTEIPYQQGWIFGNKMGKADEKVQFREIYRNDTNFHEDIYDKTGLDLTQTEGSGPDQKPDNWLSGRLWYERCYEMVDGGSEPAKSQMIFYRQSPNWLMQHSEAIQSEGVLDDPASYAWRWAGREWKKFGERQIDTTFGDTIYLTEIKAANNDYKVSKEEFEDFCGETFLELAAKRKEVLSDEQNAALEKDYAERTFEEILIAQNAENVLEVRPMSVAKAVPEEKRVKALQMAKALEAKRAKISHIEIYRNQINYSYWEQRCVAEQQQSALDARVSMYEAEQLLEKGELDAALEYYETAWENWNDLFNKHPAMMIDDAADEVLAAIERYRKLREKELDDEFILAKFMKFRVINEENLADEGLLSVITIWPELYPDRDFLDEMLSKSESRYNEQMELLRQAEANGDTELDAEVSETGGALMEMKRDVPPAEQQAKINEERAKKKAEAAKAAETETDADAGAEDPATGEATETAEQASSEGEAAEESSETVAVEEKGREEAAGESPTNEEAAPEKSSLEVTKPESGSPPGPKKD